LEGVAVKTEDMAVKDDDLAVKTIEVAVKNDGLAVKMLEVAREHEDLHEQIFQLIKTFPGITIDEIAHTTKTPKRTIERKIQELKEIGRLQRIGSPRAGSWMAIDKES
jgi:cell filamentation protein, protein adenylyltransferase